MIFRLARSSHRADGAPEANVREEALFHLTLSDPDPIFHR
jgi:hypothetical protein